jgi:predicted transcriptional regulator
MTKVMTIRIDDDLNDEVDAVARTDDLPVSEVVRAALRHYIAARKSDPQFQARLRELQAKDTEVIGRLAAGGSS